MGLDTAFVKGTTYLFVTGNSDDGISVFSVGANGVLTNVFNLSDDSNLALLSPWGVTAFQLNEEIFLSVSSVGDDAVDLFHVDSNGSLSNVVVTPDIARVCTHRFICDSMT